VVRDHTRLTLDDPLGRRRGRGRIALLGGLGKDYMPAGYMAL